MLEELAFVSVRGLGLGALFALLALSLNVIYQATHILNFAQGSMLVLGGLAGVMLSGHDYGTPVWFAGMLATGLVMAAVMAVQGVITLWPLRHSTEQQSWLITTLAVSIIISAVLLLTQGPWSSEFIGEVPSFPVLDMRTPLPYLVLPLMAAFWFVALRLFLRRSLQGLALSALSQDLDAAAAAGLHVKRLQIAAFAISGLITGTAGYAAAPIISISAESGIRYVISGFVVAVVGGMGSMAGAIVAGPLVGILAMIATYRFGGQYQGFVSLIVLAGMLFLKPNGLFGFTAARRV